MSKELDRLRFGFNILAAIFKKILQGLTFIANMRVMQEFLNSIFKGIQLSVPYIYTSVAGLIDIAVEVPKEGVLILKRILYVGSTITAVTVINSIFIRIGNSMAVEIFCAGTIVTGAALLALDDSPLLQKRKRKIEEKEEKSEISIKEDKGTQTSKVSLAKSVVDEEEEYLKGMFSPEASENIEDSDEEEKGGSEELEIDISSESSNRVSLEKKSDGNISTDSKPGGVFTLLDNLKDNPKTGSKSSEDFPSGVDSLEEYKEYKRSEEFTVFKNYLLSANMNPEDVELSFASADAIAFYCKEEASDDEVLRILENSKKLEYKISSLLGDKYIPSFRILDLLN